MTPSLRVPTSTVRVLLVEDSDTDAALVIRQLRRGGLDPTFERVETEAEFRAALAEKTWDIVISDHTLPRFSGLVALTTLQATRKDIPFILVSGTIGETVAVAAMKAGAHDYVLKDQLTRLPAAVEREVREASIRADERRMREQLVISERMASAGTLAAGVAHEINNPLAVAMANLEFMATMLASVRSEIRSTKASAGPGEGWLGWLEGRLGEVDEPLRDAREAVDRIRGIVRDVKLFSRSQDDHTGPIDVERVVESSLRLAWNEIRHRAALVKEYAIAPKVDANESRLGQVVLNLIVNAAQSMPDGNAAQNTIRVGTKTTDAGWAVIEVADTGSGIRKEDLDRIFDPFFTTKPVGVGTGLGLAICHRIVSDLNGRIEVETELGKGTVFRILLPPTRTDVAEVRPAAEAARTTRRGRLLVVDDEPGIGRAIRRSLSPHHDVTALTSAADALALIAGGQLFDVILSDVMMPEVTGLEFQERLSVLAPDQARRIIFLTGGAFTTKAREFLDRMPNQRIEKPFEMDALLAVIASALE